MEQRNGYSLAELMKEKQEKVRSTYIPPSGEEVMVVTNRSGSDTFTGSRCFYCHPDTREAE